ncbi:MAG: hypothetical protein QM765_26875 [Myxococcales bacterium]
MRALAGPGPLRNFRRSNWEFQATFVTPLGRLPEFVGAILGSARQPFESGALEIEEIVFEPKHLMALAARHSLPCPIPRAFDATSFLEVEELLTAALGDWVDFLFVPSPKPFVIYADHHEYTTLLAHRRRGLTRVLAALSGRFEEIRGYRR